MPAFIDLTGKCFGRLTVLNLNLDRSSKKRKFWNCLCSCGNMKAVDGENLKLHKTSSCGCLAKELHPIIQAKRRRFSPEEYSFRQIWKLMMRRCYSPKDATYCHYGARSISVCPSWHDYENFKRDMWPRPEGLSLERIDNDGNYEPSNCKWATRIEQANNRRTNKFVEMNGEIKTVAEWARFYKVESRIVYERLARNWDLHNALTKPVRKIRVDSKFDQEE